MCHQQTGVMSRQKVTASWHRSKPKLWSTTKTGRMRMAQHKKWQGCVPPTIRGNVQTIRAVSQLKRLFNCMKAVPVAWHTGKWAPQHLGGLGDKQDRVSTTTERASDSGHWQVGSPAPRGLGRQARQSKYHHRTGQRLGSQASGLPST